MLFYRLKSAAVLGGFVMEGGWSKMKRFFMIVLLAAAFIIAPLSALAGQTMVTLRVDGLSCPFCAYGLEKRIKKMEGVKDLTIDIENGTVTVVYQDKKFFTEQGLSKTVKEAGFTPKGMVLKDTGE